MKREAGFTLIESLFAMAIFGIAMLVLMSLQINSIRNDEETHRKDTATRLLSQAAEEVEFSNYKDTEIFSEKRKLSGWSSGYNSLLAVAEGAGSNNYEWMKSGDEKVVVYLGHVETTTAVNPPVHLRHVHLIAAWNSTTSNERHTLARVMVKPENIFN